MSLKKVRKQPTVRGIICLIQFTKTALWMKLAYTPWIEPKDLNSAKGDTTGICNSLPIILWSVQNLKLMSLTNMITLFSHKTVYGFPLRDSRILPTNCKIKAKEMDNYARYIYFLW